MTDSYEANIQSKKILAEGSRKNYEKIRLTRIKYKNNPEPCIDIRLFQRGFDENENEVYHPTKKGIQFAEKDFQDLIGDWKLLPTMILNQKLVDKVWHLFKNKDYNTAIFKAFKELEIAVRETADYSDETIGTNLMRKAFNPQTGPLTNEEIPKAERESIAHLFAGAIGLYKNPHSHRDINIEFNEAFEMLLLASHLLNYVENINKEE